MTFFCPIFTKKNSEEEKTFEKKKKKKSEKRSSSANEDVDDKREHPGGDHDEEARIRASARASAYAYGQNGTCFMTHGKALYARYSILSRIGNARWQKSRRLDVSLSLSL